MYTGLVVTPLYVTGHINIDLWLLSLGLDCVININSECTSPQPVDQGWAIDFSQGDNEKLGLMWKDELNAVLRCQSLKKILSSSSSNSLSQLSSCSFQRSNTNFSTTSVAAAIPPPLAKDAAQIFSMK